MLVKSVHGSSDSWAASLLRGCHAQFPRNDRRTSQCRMAFVVIGHDLMANQRLRSINVRTACCCGYGLFVFRISLNVLPGSAASAS